MSNDQEVNATEAAIEFAKEQGVDITLITGTGKDGRIGQPDVQKFIDSQKEENGSEEESDGSDANTQESTSDGDDEPAADTESDEADEEDESDDEDTQGGADQESDSDEAEGESDDEPVVEPKKAKKAKAGTALKNFKHNGDRYKVGDAFEGSKDDAKELRKKGLIA